MYKKRIQNKKAEIMEDPDLDMEITILTKSNLKNQAHTLRFSRLMVRAKLKRAKSQLLCILRNGELACRRLFLDYHGLKLLYTWMCDSISTDVQKEWEFRLEILDTLEVLPIPNKTMLLDSKVLSTVSKWAKATNLTENGSSSAADSPNDEISEVSPTSNNCQKSDIALELHSINAAAAADIGVDALKQILLTNENNQKKLNESSGQEIELMDRVRGIASKLVTAWNVLPEVFRIPKKLRIEQMKEHEREANQSYQALGLTEEEDDSRHNQRYYKDRTRERDKDRGDFEQRREQRQRYERYYKDPEMELSKLQRRQQFEAKV